MNVTRDTHEVLYIDCNETLHVKSILPKFYKQSLYWATYICLKDDIQELISKKLMPITVTTTYEQHR